MWNVPWKWPSPLCSEELVLWKRTVAEEVKKEITEMGFKEKRSEAKEERGRWGICWSGRRWEGKKETFVKDSEEERRGSNLMRRFLTMVFLHIIFCFGSSSAFSSLWRTCFLSFSRHLYCLLLIGLGHSIGIGLGFTAQVGPIIGAL